MTQPLVLLPHDPQPGLLLDAKAQPLELNPALRTLLGTDPQAALPRCLPSNHLHLVRACLDQRRAIEGVEAQFGDRVLLWTYIPDPPGERCWPAAGTPPSNCWGSGRRPGRGGCTG